MFTLDDIEHGLLRLNAPHPATKKRRFPEGDARAALVLPELEPRLHFALNCGAKSCPPVRVFSADNLERGLELAARGFCDGEVEVREDGTVVMSKIFEWYGGDFGPTKAAMLKKVAGYMGEEKRAKLERLVEEEGEEISVEFSAYDWTLNTK